MQRPTSRAELRTWIADYCSLTLPETAVCPGHNSPLEYIEHAFFEKGDCFVWACRGGGKTILGAVTTLLDMLFKPGIQVRILAGSFEQAERMYAYLRTFVENNFQENLDGKITERGFKFTNGSRVEVLAQSQRSVRGTHVQKLRCDEIELFTPEIWEAAQLATKSKRPKNNDDGGFIRGSVEGLSTMHMVDGLMSKLTDRARENSIPVFTWCVWDIAQQCPAERPCETCALHDHCQGKAKQSAGYLSIDDLIAMRRRVADRVWENEALCLPPKWEDCVFGRFDRAKNVRRFDPWPNSRYIMGVDFGFAGAFAATWMHVSGKGESGMAHVTGEFVRSRATLRENLHELLRIFGASLPKIAYVDPAGLSVNSHTAESDIRVMKDAGFRVLYPRHRLQPSLRVMERMISPSLGEPTLTIDPNCKKLIAALENYRWQSAQTAKPHKDGVHDHILDALRYGLMGELSLGYKSELTNYTP